MKQVLLGVIIGVAMLALTSCASYQHMKYQGGGWYKIVVPPSCTPKQVAALSSEIVVLCTDKTIYQESM